MIEAKPIVGITMGDAAGVGPEIIAMALCREDIRDICNPLVIGDSATMEAAVGIVGCPIQIVALKRVDEAQFREGLIEVRDDGQSGILSFQMVINGLDSGACPGRDPGFTGVTTFYGTINLKKGNG